VRRRCTARPVTGQTGKREELLRFYMPRTDLATDKFLGKAFGAHAIHLSANPPPTPRSSAGGL
jgi:hypothetical protein